MERNTEPIDIHGIARQFSGALVSIAQDERMLPEQRAVIERYINDARTGRTVKRGSHKRIGQARCAKVIYALKRFAVEVRRPFEHVQVQDVERFILGLEDGTVRKARPTRTSTRYSQETILDFKKILRAFFRYLYPGDPKRVEELTGWFDTREVRGELDTFGPDEARRLARAIGSPQGAAFIMLLFDGGLRAGEVLNLRLYDVEFRVDPTGGRACYVHVRVSKTIPRIVALPLASEEVQFWAERHPSGGRVLPNGKIDAKDINARLFLWSYANARKVVCRLGQQELGARLYLHRFRHASASFYARYLKEYQMCVRYGWVLGSDVVRRYVNRSSLVAEDTVHIIRRELGPAPLRLSLPEQLKPAA